MILQNIVLPYSENFSDEKLFCRCSAECAASEFPVELTKGQCVSFDTYFNAFSIKKWRKYTDLQELSAAAEVSGVFLFELFGRTCGGEARLLYSETFSAQERKEFSVSVSDLSDDMIYFSLTAEEDGSRFYGGRFEDSADAENYSEVSIALNICTFRREQDLDRNLKMLEKNIFSDKKSPLCGKLQVFISDNGKTIDASGYSAETVHVFPNKNVGGAGGFTRGLIETLRANCPERPITHVIFMDDDIILHPATLELTYTFLRRLKPEYSKACLGGAMLRRDMPHLLYEAGAQWNSGSIQSLKSNLDLRDFNNVLESEREECIEYQGWWYCCFPLNSLSEQELPLPFFIHRDDIEYSLRLVKSFITLSGIGVWHEPFKQKHVAFLEYYDVRNIAVTNAIHCPDYSRSQYKKMLLWKVMKNISRFHYLETELNFRAAEDFCRGIDWLKEQDGEWLHKEIGQMGYQKLPLERLLPEFEAIKKQEKIIDTVTDKAPQSKLKFMLTLNGWLLPASYKSKMPVTLGEVRNYYRMKCVLVVAGDKGYIVRKSWKELFRTLGRYFEICRLIDKKYDTAKAEYHERYKELTGMEFWERYLGI